MQYLMTMRPGTTEPDAALYTEMGAFVAEMSAAGVLVATGGLDEGSRVVAKGGEVTITDGPFAEAKEVIASFAVVEVASREQLLELTHRFYRIIGDGEGMIQQVFGPE
jgi:hypothetical protein